MINIIGIYDGCYEQYDEETIYKSGLGGSESWVIAISEALAQIKNTHIIVYCNCASHIHKDYKNIEYLPHEYFLSNNIKYDALLISRVLHQNVIDTIKQSNSCNNIYLMCHDNHLTYYNNYNYADEELYYQKIADDEFLHKCIKKIFTLSDWHKQLFNEKYGYPLDFIELTGHGINDDLLNIDTNIPRDNSILWSSSIWRNFDILVKYIAPKIIEKYPDFKIYFSYYGNLNADWNLDFLYLLDYDYVINLGNLTKIELHKEMIKHKCAFYPSLCTETFCITSIEQAMCENHIIMPLRYGPATIFEPYKYMFLDDNNYFETEKDINNAANKIINVLDTYYDEDKIAFRKSIKHYLISKYNWNNISFDLFNKMNLHL